MRYRNGKCVPFMTIWNAYGECFAVFHDGYGEPVFILIALRGEGEI